MVVVVVVRMVCLYDVSIHATQPHAINSSGRSPGSQTPGDPPPLPRPMTGVNPGSVPVHRALPSP